MHGETVAEHVFAIIFLAQYFLPLEDPEGKIDKAKLYEISLFHDFGEILNGDIPYHRKTEVHEIQEAKDAEIVFKSLPDSVGAIGAIRWKEYEDRATFEARFAYALDKIEPTFELLDPISEKSLKREKFTYEAHLGKKQKATEQFPVMRRFVDVLAAHIKDRGVFWEG